MRVAVAARARSRTDDGGRVTLADRGLRMCLMLGVEADAVELVDLGPYPGHFSARLVLNGYQKAWGWGVTKERAVVVAVTHRMISPDFTLDALDLRDELVAALMPFLSGRVTPEMLAALFVSPFPTARVAGIRMSSL